MKSFVFLISLWVLPFAAWACPVCMGPQEGKMAEAYNYGVLFLLATIVTLLVGFAIFIFRLRKRAIALEKGRQ